MFNHVTKFRSDQVWEKTACNFTPGTRAWGHGSHTPRVLPTTGHDDDPGKDILAERSHSPVLIT